jgi:hypothetical protein
LWDNFSFGANSDSSRDVGDGQILVESRSVCYAIRIRQDGSKGKLVIGEVDSNDVLVG